MGRELNLQFQTDYKHYKLYSFDIKYIETPIKPNMNSESRLLFFTKGTGKIKIYDKEYDITSNVLLAIFPWEIAEITDVAEPMEVMEISYNSVFSSLILNILNKYKKNKVHIFSLMKEIPAIYFSQEEAKKIENIFSEIKNEIEVESFSEFDILTDKKKSNEENDFDLNKIYIINKLTELLIIIAKKIISEKDNLPKKKRNN